MNLFNDAPIDDIDIFLQQMNDNGYDIKSYDLITKSTLNIVSEMARRITDLEQKINHRETSNDNN